MKQLLQPIRLPVMAVLTLLTVLAACTTESTPEVYAVAGDADGGVWAGTKDGLYHKTNKDGVFSQMPLPSISHHPFPAVYTLCSDTLRSRLWIGAWNHLYCYDLARKRFIVTRDSSIHQTVGLVCDSLGRIRAFTGHGQYRFTLSDSLSGGEQTEQLDSICYPKPEYANIDAAGWLFEQKDGHGSLVPWLVVLVLAVGIVVMLFVKRRGRNLTPNPSPKEREVYSSSTESSKVNNNHSPLLGRGTGGEVSSLSFLERAQKVVDAHLDDEDFSIDQMASELAVSRAQLFRKLKSANGQTPKELIDERRMALAASLLSTTDRSISNIAWDCGFNDASNFRRTFVRVYGMTPSAYQNTYRINELNK
ncbi:MAG: helix-turn-helix domain-containing protein [Prevotella sp.]|nr:helix-turn-helix domain-containing protein [Prevotella sp.]